MKLNKEILTKQRFWFCLGGFVLVWLIGFIVVKASAGPKVTEAKKTYDGATGKLNVPDPKSPAFMQPWDDAAKFYSEEVAKVWRKAWDMQKDLNIWPQSSNGPFATWWNTSDTWKDWHKKATGSETGKACDAYREELYGKQFVSLLNELNSTEDYALLLKDGELKNAKIGPVEFKNGLHGYKVVMLPALASGAGPEGGRMAAPADRAGGPGTAHNVDNVFAKCPTVEECWYAQEDFWLKREILRTVKRTVDSVAKFTREEPGFWTSVTQRIEYPDRVFSPLADPKEKPEGKELIRQRFRNPNWELDLFFVEEKGEEGKVFYAVTNPSSIRNVSGRSQALSRPPTKDPKTGKEIPRGYLEFTILQGEGKFKLEIQGDDLAAGKEAKIRAKDPKVVLTSGRTTFDPRKPFEVVQVFDWYTAPIRRIEEIRTCVHSHRTANIPLKPHKELYKPEPPPAAAPPPAGTNPPPAAAAPPANAPCRRRRPTAWSGTAT